MRLLFALLGLLFLLGCVSPPLDQTAPPASTVPKVCFDTQCFLVEVADSPSEREQGLMFRTFLEEEKGMLFVFEEEGIHSFWMKNTLIPLDAVWINGENEVVDIQTMLPCDAEPCVVYTPKQDALYVLEMGAGVAEKNGIEVGQHVMFQHVNENEKYGF